MGDEHDDMDIISRVQSGNVDQGHISNINDLNELEQTERGNQGALLNDTLNNYYNENDSFVALRTNLMDLGYSTERTETLLAGAHAERVYRISHDNIPSDLSINQLEFLETSGIELANQHAHIRVDTRGKYYEDYRLRDGDGNPSRLYLPNAEIFDELTQDQQDEFNRIRMIDTQITIQNPDINDLTLFYKTDIDQNTIHQLSQISAGYLNGPHTAQNEQAFMNRVQSLQGLENIEGIRGKLTEYFLDINDELEYRDKNDGRPRGLSDIEWSFLQDNNNINGEYYGQPILLTHTTPPQKYFVSGTTILIIDNNIVEPTNSRQLTGTDDRAINDYTVDIFDDPNMNEETIRQLLFTGLNFDPENPNDFEVGLDIEDRTERIIEEKRYRDNNNGRPSQLTQLQYDFMLEHTLAYSDLYDTGKETRYRGEPIRIQQQSSTGRGRGRDFRETPIIYGYYPYGSDTSSNFLMIPTDEIINQMIENGIYKDPTKMQSGPSIHTDLPHFTLPDPVDRIDPKLLKPAEHPQPIPTLPEGFRPITDDELKGYLPLIPLPVEKPDNILTELGRADKPPSIDLDPHGFFDNYDPDTTEIEPILIKGNPPIIPGQTQPLTYTGENIPVDTPQGNLSRYSAFFYNNQNLYKGFNEMFRDILPVFTGFTGAYAGFSLAKMKYIGGVEEILQQEKNMLNLLNGRLNNLENQLEAEKQILDNLPSITVEQDIKSFTRLDLLQRTPMMAFFLESQYGIQIPDIFKKEIQGITVIDPDMIDIAMTDAIGRITDEAEQVKALEKVVDKLQKDIDQGLINRAIINSRLDKIINENYTILINIQKYSPQILTGFNIGHSLGFVLGGYFFPTYIDIDADEDYIKNNIDLPNNRIDNQVEEIKSKVLPFHVAVDSKPINIYGQHSINKLKLEVDTLNKSDNIFKPYLTGNRPLNMTEINDMKMTLNFNELKKLEGNMLMFQEGSNIVPKMNICRGVIGQGDLGDQSIRSRPIKFR